MEANKEFVCKNCKSSHNEGDLFCYSCGQRTKLGRLTIKEIVTEFFSSVFNIDAPFPKTLAKMFLKPHLVFKEYIGGKRKEYYAPVKYMVLCLFLNILIGALVGFDPIENQRSLDSGGMNKDSVIGYKAGEFLSQYLNYFLFILPFSIAFFSKLFFWKSSYNLAERITIGFYLSGQFIVISLIPIFLSLINPLLFHIMYPITIGYFTFAFYKFFNTPSKILKGVLSFFTSFLSLVGYMSVAFIIALLIVIKFNL